MQSNFTLNLWKIIWELSVTNFNNLEPRQRSGSEHNKRDVSNYISNSGIKRNTLHAKKESDLIRPSIISDSLRKKAEHRYTVYHKNDSKNLAYAGLINLSILV
jgi:hypothetical protein